MATTHIASDDPEQELATLIHDELEHQYDGNQSELHRQSGVSQPTISRMLNTPGRHQWDTVGPVVETLGLDRIRCFELWEAARRRTYDLGAWLTRPLLAAA